MEILEITRDTGCERILILVASDDDHELLVQDVRAHRQWGFPVGDEWGRVVQTGEGGTMDMLDSRGVIPIWRMEELVEWLARSKLHPETLITHRFPLDKARDAYEEMATGDCVKTVVCFDEELVGAVYTPQLPCRIQSAATFGLAELPRTGLGFLGARFLDIAPAVQMATDMGYRHFDCRHAGRLTPWIGGRIRQAYARNGLERRDVWITGKFCPDLHDDPFEACRNLIQSLDCDYLDLYLAEYVIEFPDIRTPGLNRLVHEGRLGHAEFMNTWHRMEQLVNSGLVRRIGTSNVSLPRMQMILTDCRIKPAVNEMETHPHFQQPVLCEFLSANDIQVMGYGIHPAAIDNDPVVARIAMELKVAPASIAVAWAVRKEQATILHSCSERDIRANLVAATVISQRLTEAHLAAIAALNLQPFRCFDGSLQCRL